jgi:hypothetical protein
MILSINHNNEFNLCKSDIAKLEGFYCGALCVHDDWPEWSWGKFHTDKKYFYERASYLLHLIRQSAPSIGHIYAQEFQYVKENRLLSEVNKQRAEVLRGVVK